MERETGLKPVFVGRTQLSPDMACFRGLVLAFVREYLGKWQISPSYGEIAAHFNASRTRVKRAVRSLVRDELLYQVPGPRGLRLPTQREDALRILRESGTDRSLLPPAELTYPAQVTGTSDEDGDFEAPDI